MFTIKHPLVVGYRGEVGSFILNGLLREMPKALDIWCVDVNETEDEVAKRIVAADVIFLCVPFELTAKWLTTHHDLLKDKIIIEQCSLKEWIYKVEMLNDLDIRSMHLLFRPSQTSIADRKVGILRDGNGFDDLLINDIKAITQSEIVMYSDAEEHDGEMALQQAFLHRTLLIIGKLLRGCQGTTYLSKKVLELEERIRKGNKSLYKNIQGNPHLSVHLEEFKRLLEGFDIDKYA
jgi:prephenate dehydrogenase